MLTKVIGIDKVMLSTDNTNKFDERRNQMPVKYDYGSLLWKIDQFGTRTSFCEAVGITTVTFRNYISGATPMPSSFIEKACRVLSIPREEIGAYFFKPDVDFCQPKTT